MKDAPLEEHTRAAARRIAVLICDDHPAYRDGLRYGLQNEPDITIVGEARDGEEAVVLARRLRPSVVLMDLAMEPVGGVEATRQIKADVPEAKVLVLTADNAHADVLHAVEAGAVGYVLKADRNREIAAAVRDVDAGLNPISGAVAGHLLTAIQQPTNAPLDREEIAVIELIAAGSGNAAIDRELKKPVEHAKRTLTKINQKLGTVDRASAAVEAMRRGYIT